MTDPGGESFASRLRESITAAGLTLRAVKDRLEARGHRVSISALSMWQSGARQPEKAESLRAVEALEEILGCESGHLRDAIGAPRRAGRPLLQEPLHEQMPHRDIASAALTALGFEDDEELPHELYVVEKVDLSRGDGTVVFEFRILMRALRAGRCHLPSVHIMAPDEPGARPVLEPLLGCAVGRQIDWPDLRTHSAELIMDEDLQVGDLAYCEYRVHFALSPSAIREATYSFSRKAREVLIQVQFAPEQEPVRCERRIRAGGEETAEPALINASNRVRVSAHDVGPGLVGLRWAWGE